MRQLVAGVRSCIAPARRRCCSCRLFLSRHARGSFRFLLLNSLQIMPVSAAYAAFFDGAAGARNRGAWKNVLGFLRGKPLMSLRIAVPRFRLTTGNDHQ